MDSTSATYTDYSDVSTSVPSITNDGDSLKEASANRVASDYLVQKPLYESLKLIAGTQNQVDIGSICQISGSSPITYNVLVDGLPAPWVKVNTTGQLDVTPPTVATGSPGTYTVTVSMTIGGSTIVKTIALTAIP